MHTTRYRRRRQTVDLKPVLGCLLALLAAGVLLWLMYASTLNPKVDEHVLRIKDLPDNLRNLRIVYLSDIHYGRWFSRQQSEQLVQQINDLSADVVILGGDYGEDPAGAVAFFDALPTIQSRNGVYAVMGDTDRSDEQGTLQQLVAAMSSRNVTALVNDTAQIKLGKSYLYIAGADDYRAGYPDVVKVARQVRSEDFVIFAGHSPNLLPAMLDARDRSGNAHWFDVALFGHTHGGQINLFGFTPFRLLRPLAGSRYLTGWLEENRAAMLISNGVGTETIPFRLFAPPQIHLIILKQTS